MSEAIPKADEAHAGLVRAIRWLVWLYFFLLIFEGAFRKWITPGLSGPLLLVRDPVVGVIYVMAFGAGIFPRNLFILTLAALMVLAMVFGVCAEQFDPAVYAFGLRTDFLHLPLIFVIARVMNYADVVLLGRWILIFSLPMTLLVVKQFQAAPDDLLNTTAGGTGLTLETSGGKVRGSGTFSFIAGVVCFYAIVAGFIINSLLRRGTYPRWLQLCGLIAVVAAVATSGSRSALGGVLSVAAMILLVVAANPAMLGRVVLMSMLVAGLAFGLLQFGVIGEGATVLSMRFEEAGGNSGIWPRMVNNFIEPFHSVIDAPFFGEGLGLGTNAGAMLATGKVQFLLAEGEWDRVIRESGPIFGVGYVLWRCLLTFYLFRRSLQAAREQNLLPMMLFGASAMFVVNGQWGQPTILGFAVLGSGLCLGACRSVEEEKLGTLEPAPAAPTQRKRSAYAETLHQR